MSPKILKVSGNTSGLRRKERSDAATIHGLARVPDNRSESVYFAQREISNTRKEEHTPLAGLDTVLQMFQGLDVLQLAGDSPLIL